MPGVPVGVIEGHGAIIHSFVKDGQIHCKNVEAPFTTESITRMLVKRREGERIVRRGCILICARVLLGHTMATESG